MHPLCAPWDAKSIRPDDDTLLSDLLPGGSINDPAKLDKTRPGMKIRIGCTGIKRETSSLGIEDNISSITSYLPFPPNPTAINLLEQSSQTVHLRPVPPLHGW